MIIAVDTGGTKTLVMGFNNSVKADKKHRFATPQDPVKYIETLSHILNTEYDLAAATAICVAAPGLILNQRISFCPNLPWYDFDLIGTLKQKITTKVPVLLQNDANLAGLAEIHELAVLPEVGMYLTVSTGVGVGVVTNGILDPILQRVESGRMVLEFDGILRDWESFASGRSIYETYGRYAHDIKDPRIWSAIADKISRGLLAIVPILMPDVIVIGGSVGSYYSHYHDVLEKLLDERLYPHLKRPRLVQAAHPQEAVLYGCNIYANQIIT
jgi:predicted NBD/HSP70 family sugar kinase